LFKQQNLADHTAIRKEKIQSPAKEPSPKVAAPPSEHLNSTEETKGARSTQNEKPDKEKGWVDPEKYVEISKSKQQIEQGYQRGLKEGKQKADQEFGDAVRALVNTCQQLDTVRETIIKNSRNELLEFALAAAERILRISLAEQDKTIILTLEEAFNRAVRSDEFTVYIHPDDMKIAQEKSAELIAGIAGLNNLVLRQDPHVERGGAKIESENCTIDATIASQFNVICEEIRNKQ